jgi:glycosyltransferase 2 family protein
MKSLLKTFVKYAVAFALLALVVRQVGTGRIIVSLRQITLPYWALAFVLASGAQIVMALRMQFFFRASGVALGTRFAVMLYYVGAFYNFLLPGGIGGDAYKVLVASKRMQLPAKQGIRIMVADRASGLCVLMLVLAGALYGIDFSGSIPFAGALLAAAVSITLIAYVVLCHRLLRQPADVMLRSLPYSMLSQLLWMATLGVVWLSIGDKRHLIEYVALYCAASIAAMLPVSVGGLGIKEATYYYGSELMQTLAGVSVDPELGVTLSLCLFAMMLLASLPGLLWMEKINKAEP